VTTGRFEFASGNLQKLVAAPQYVLSMLFSFFVPRDGQRWVFGSGIGVGEGALAVARALRADDPNALIAWLVTSEFEAAQAEAEGFMAVQKRGWAGFWATLRAGQIVVTHGLGDVNRFGVFGGRVVNLIHGAPLKKLHLDSAVTTQVGGPAPVQAVLRRMYSVGAKQIALYVAGSVTAAERLRSAYRVAPGKVRVLGDPRDDVVCAQANDARAADQARARVRALLGLSADALGAREPLVLYAPTWRDGEADPAQPTTEQAVRIAAALDALGARLLVRSHPLGAGAYEALLGGRVHFFGTELAREITPLLGAFDAVITDYSSIALDFSLFGRPIVWFAPDLERYSANRGLYEPLEVTAAGRVQRSWEDAMDRLAMVLPDSLQRRVAEADARTLAARYHAHPEGGAARRVVAEIRALSLPDEQRVPEGAVFFESFYGKQVSCNPLALDREIAVRFAEVPRYWSVTSERTQVPDGAIAVLVGSPDWFAARRRAQLLVVNDWLRFGFRRAKHQIVLQTWHGTMLKHLALGRPGVSLRTRLAIWRESRRWSLMLSQNAHSTAQFRSSYAFHGEVLELGYPRDDRLAAAVAGGERISFAADAAKRVLGADPAKRVLAYIPTWRDGGQHVNTLDVQALAQELGEEWVIVARGHTRSSGSYAATLQQSHSLATVIDASAHPDVNDVILAADVLVTDYSSVMFDAAVARVPMLFFVPDLASYRDRERGFTFDFEATAPGPLLTTRAEVVEAVRAGVSRGEAYEAWCERFVPHDDGHAAKRVVDALVARGALAGWGAFSG
jgi:CDP-glycerol glycerophosphotransferase (TagB/SpsB family)